MEIITSIEQIREISENIRKNGQSLAMVPTMGCLHEGHKSLIDKARKENDKLIVSIFVNPMQFGPDEDYDNYPRDLEADSKLCQNAGVDYIFHPKADEMYPNSFSTYVEPCKQMTDILCGISRPGHFRGVCTVLAKFFSIIRPNRAYFGQKDAQQLAIVKRMVKDLNLNVEITGCPIIREEDGLAKSSRNLYLNEDERKAASILRKSILLGLKEIDAGQKSSQKVLDTIKSNIEKEKLAKIDYVEILDFDTFERVDDIQGNILIALAVYIGKTRLIDNIVI
ncbi:pantoate--beta-alanine ligase [Peptostreptococcus equinus]|uniref:Pantothenate synthetase n=1 Tax=Peptostreptococcus equinus TaxID=3003601 RepID=A0ABY7JNF3_9FIRM|nr:pantoate--beta-alanine ligase [Peptostreptococcus sp. CBA3647]WAW14908.1 pantoate--beta-alanine ligase [Peptostreptococcus sp. CBA3647]